LLVTNRTRWRYWIRLDETGGYEEMVILRGIAFESHCEHHLAPIVGQAWVAYVPNGRVVGLSKLARVVDAYAKRLQIQERMISEIASAVQEVLQPQALAW
jgi:GTP cyclohydrolase I